MTINLPISSVSPKKSVHKFVVLNKDLIEQETDFNCDTTTIYSEFETHCRQNALIGQESILIEAVLLRHENTSSICLRVMSDSNERLIERIDFKSKDGSV